MEMPVRRPALYAGEDVARAWPWLVLLSPCGGRMQTDSARGSSRVPGLPTVISAHCPYALGIISITTICAGMFSGGVLILFLMLMTYSGKKQPRNKRVYFSFQRELNASCVVGNTKKEPPPDFSSPFLLLLDIS